MHEVLQAGLSTVSRVLGPRIKCTLENDFSHVKSFSQTIVGPLLGWWIGQYLVYSFVIACLNDGVWIACLPVRIGGSFTFTHTAVSVFPSPFLKCLCSCLEHTWSVRVQLMWTCSFPSHPYAEGHFSEIQKLSVTCHCSWFFHVNLML